MSPSRRSLISAAAAGGLTLASSGVVAAAGPRPRGEAATAGGRGVPAGELGLEPGSERDQTAALQAAIDRLAPTGTPLFLPPGRYRTGRLELKPGSRLTGVAGATRLELAGSGPLMAAAGAGDVRLEGLVIDGADRPLAGGRAAGLVQLAAARRIALRDLVILGSPGHGIALAGAGGSIRDCTVSAVGEAAIFSLDAEGLEITHNHVADAANNGIQVWRSKPGEDGTMVIANRIERVAARAGGSGQNGNGINVFRAASVLVAKNRITDCAFSAIRGNAASNVQMIANSVQRIGEVALYAEFGFEGAMIQSNLIDGAAAGISVTNFNEGGRLAVVQANIVRNLARREHEPVDKRGEGISVEADAVVGANVVENAATAGITIGWGHWMRDVVASNNLLRGCRIGIGVSADRAGGAVMLTANLISGARDGAIRGLDHGRPVGDDLTRGGRLANVTLGGNVVA
jgi:uncharacterized secreted repeat protein (TIGR03808 family)